ncbi:hypothetical protein BRD17_09550 [Halobacteriales archaeon SW_7_68_16]|nr:MAG: hypothetical protein BRD17_09550 [Halobacteriales archaeon SW_7_68_16]
MDVEGGPSPGGSGRSRPSRRRGDRATGNDIDDGPVSVVATVPATDPVESTEVALEKPDPDIRADGRRLP